MRCMQQLVLLKHWNRLREAAEVPRASAVVLADLGDAMDVILFCDVQPSTRESRYLIRFMGRQLVDAYRKDAVGTYLHDLISPCFRRAVLQGYDHVVAAREPHFDRMRVRKGSGPEISDERLLLPFSDNGHDVSRILTAVTFFSDASGFDRSDATTGSQIDGVRRRGRH